MSFLDGKGTAAALEAFRQREARRLVGQVSIPCAEFEGGFLGFVRRTNRTLLDHEHVHRLVGVC